MSEQRCVCGHPFSIHKLNRAIGNRNECWFKPRIGQELWCQCRQFEAAGPAPGEAEDGD